MFLCLSPKRMFSSAVPLSFIIDAVRYCWTREFPVVFVGKHRTSFVVLVKDAYNSHNSFSLTAKLSIIRGLGIFPNKHFPAFPFLRRAGKLHLYRQMPSLPVCYTWNKSVISEFALMNSEKSLVFIENSLKICYNPSCHAVA